MRKIKASRTFVTETDSGGTSFNWSEVAGNGVEAGLSNAYCPRQERGLSQGPAKYDACRKCGAQISYLPEILFRSNPL